MQNITRRRFFSTTCKIGSAIGITLTSRPASSAAGGANDKIILGLIGAGSRGSSLSTGLAGIDGVEIKGPRKNGQEEKWISLVMEKECGPA